MKKCTKCKHKKDVNHFSKKSSSKDGLDYWCKECKKDKTASYNNEANYNGSKTCKTCNLYLNRIYFHKDKRKPDGLENRCKKCCAERSRANSIKSKYDIDKSEYDTMFKAQNGKCKICNTSDPGNGKNYMLVDHCHDTGKVRGLLCSSCNFAIGLMKDDSKLLIKAARYLDEKDIRK